MDAKPLAEALLTATAAQDAAAARVTAYREALTDAMRTLWDAGIKATIPLDGLGKAEWRTYEPTARVQDAKAFVEWASYLTTTRLTFNGPAAALALSLLTEAGIDYTEETLLRDGDRDAILARLTPTPDGQAVTADGELVPGVVFEAQPPNLYVTVDRDVKTAAKRAARAAVIEELTDRG